MGTFRKALPCLSLLLLAVLVPVQAAGCCKWSALLGWPGSPARSAVAAQDISGGMAADHACCRKQAPDREDPSPAPAASDCGSGGKGCCLQGERPSHPALASIPAAFADGLALLLLLPAGECPRAVSPLPVRTRPKDSGPPPYLAHLRLLI